ncbi:MAG: tetratricopeptide repeat protein, partial [Candidatus Staskawiczbacteria bacterium]|nr:tetratricopeptide repeat protein [Candidatus Staskawiczbacteria bacterium]
VLNVLSTAGILGFLVLFVFMVLPIFYAVKFLILEKDDSRNRIMTLGVLSVLIMQVLIYFLYNSNLTLEFLSFFMIASLVVLTSVEKKEYQLRSSSLFTLIITFSFTLFFIFGFGLIILDGQRYVAEIRYSKALSFLQAGDKNLGTKNMESAVYLNSSSDLYLEQLSQAYLINLQDEIKNVTSTPTDQEKSKVQVLITNSVNAAKMATDLNPNSSDAWSNRGYVYQSLNGLISDSTTWAIKSYDQALSLNPNDPYIFYQEGIVYYVAKQNQNAKEKLEKAVALTPDYSNALYFLGLSYDALGDKVKALEQFNKIQQLNPEDKIIQNIINNLNAGLSALQQPAEIPVTPPTTEAVTPVIK